MTGSRNRRRSHSPIAAAFLVALGLGLDAAAQGQGGAPLSLLPPVLDPAAPGATPGVPIPPEGPIDGGPIRLSPGPLVDPTPSISRPGGRPGELGMPLDGTDPRGAALPGAVDMRPLDTPPVAATAVQEPVPTAPGGDIFGPTLWQGADQALVGQLLVRLPAPARSRAGTALTRLLLHAAMPFAGLRPDVVARLARAGDAEALAMLAADPAALAALPPESISAVVQAVAALPDRQRLCAAGFDRLTGDAGLNPDVLRAAALCKAIAGDAAGAQLALDLARDRGGVSEGFDRLLSALLGGERAIARSVSGTDTLSLFAAEALGIALTDANYAGAPALSLGLLARVNGPLEYRIEAAERGEAVGLVSLATLATLYSTGPTPTGAVAGLPPALQRVSLRRASVEASGPAVRAQAIAALVDAGVRVELAGTLARVERQAIADLASQSLPPPIAAGLVRAALWAGDEAAALAQLMRLGQVTGDHSSRPANLLWPYQALLAGVGGRPLPGGVDAYIDAVSGGSAGARKAALAAALLDGLGLAVPAKLADAGRAGHEGTSPVPEGVSRQLEDMILAGRRGEAVAIVLVILGDRPLSALSPAEANLAVTSLRRVGLAADAKALAIEAALSAGL